MNGSGEEALPRVQDQQLLQYFFLLILHFFPEVAFELHARTLYYYTLSSYSSKLKRLAQAPTDAGSQPLAHLNQQIGKHIKCEAYKLETYAFW